MVRPGFRDDQETSRPYAHVTVIDGNKRHSYSGYIEKYYRYLDWKSQDLTLTWNDGEMTHTNDNWEPPEADELDMPNVGEFYD